MDSELSFASTWVCHRTRTSSSASGADLSSTSTAAIASTGINLDSAWKVWPLILTGHRLENQSAP